MHRWIEGGDAITLLASLDWSHELFWKKQKKRRNQDVGMRSPGPIRIGWHLHIAFTAKWIHNENSAEIILCFSYWPYVYCLCRNKRPGRLIYRSNKKHSKTHEKPSVLCTPPFEKSPITTHRFHVLPPLKNHPSLPIGFMYSPLWKITHHYPSVLCTPPFEKSPITTHRFCVLPPLKNHPSKS